MDCFPHLTSSCPVRLIHDHSKLRYLLFLCNCCCEMWNSLQKMKLHQHLYQSTYWKKQQAVSHELLLGSCFVFITKWGKSKWIGILTKEFLKRKVSCLLLLLLNANKYLNFIYLKNKVNRHGTNYWYLLSRSHFCCFHAILLLIFKKDFVFVFAS